MASTTEQAEAVTSPFMTALSRRVLLSDGAMGTVLQERGIPVDACLEQANAENPDLVRQLHLEYIEAGADLIQTNTFGANRFRLEAYGLQDRAADLNRRGAEIAREAVAAAGRTVFVAGDVGPLGRQVPEDQARAAFAEQMTALAGAGIDLFLIETFTALPEAVLAVRTAREVAPRLPVVAQMSFRADGKTADGHSAARGGAGPARSRRRRGGSELRRRAPAGIAAWSKRWPRSPA